MSAYTLTREARADMAAIRLYYSTRSPAAGRKVLADIRGWFRLAAANPMSGRERSELQAGLRSVVALPYVVYFQPTDDGVEISRVVHGSRHVDPSMFPG